MKTLVANAIQVKNASGQFVDVSAIKSPDLTSSSVISALGYTPSNGALTASKASPTFTGSISLGRKVGTTVGAGSIAVGDTVTASGNCSQAEGGGTTASAAYSHAEGSGTTASNSMAHAEGGGNTASGTSSHAEGSGTTASNLAAHSEGGGTQASGSASHAEGGGSKATATNAHAEGGGTIASGEYSHAEGKGTLASSAVQHAQGKYNIEDTSGVYAHIVGNGSYANNVIVYSNAHTLDWGGNAWFAGDVYVGSTSGKNKDAGSKKLVKGSGIGSLVAITQEDYDLLETKDPNTLYVIKQ